MMDGQGAPPVILRGSTRADRELWDVVPDAGQDGKICEKSLEKWVKTARKLAKAKDRGEIADQKIGKVLALSPVGEDGIWPALEVRELIESRNKCRLHFLPVQQLIDLRYIRHIGRCAHQAIPVE